MRNLQAIRKGHLAQDINESLQSLVNMVMESGRAGALTVKIGLKPVSKNEDQIHVTYTITITPPKAEPGSSILWASEDGELLRNAPEVDDKPLKEVV